jgi:hypothetical protein
MACLRGIATLACPMRASVCMIWRCRLVRSTASSSTIVRLPDAGAGQVQRHRRAQAPGAEDRGRARRAAAAGPRPRGRRAAGGANSAAVAGHPSAHVARVHGAPRSLHLGLVLAFSTRVLLTLTGCPLSLGQRLLQREVLCRCRIPAGGAATAGLRDSSSRRFRAASRSFSQRRVLHLGLAAAVEVLVEVGLAHAQHRERDCPRRCRRS